jgi:antitoxin component YwqK of YwqJK toxin-antitoxin module
MKYLQTISILFFFLISCNDYQTIILTEDNDYFSLDMGFVNYKGKVFSGLIITEHINGVISEKINYKDGMKNGKEEIFYPNGKLSKITYYKDNQMVGELNSFHENGEVHEVGLSNGDYVSYYNDGEIKSKGQFVNGEMEGKFIFYNHLTYKELSERIEFERNYKNGKKEGKEFIYNTKGDLVFEYNYKDNEKEGEQIEYFPEFGVGYKYNIRNNKKQPNQELYGIGKYDFKYKEKEFKIRQDKKNGKLIVKEIKGVYTGSNRTITFSPEIKNYNNSEINNNEIDGELDRLYYQSKNNN